MTDKPDANWTGEFSDDELIESFNLPKELKGKPQINDALLDTVFKRNVTEYMRKGYSRQVARAKARKNRDQAKKHLMNTKPQ